MRHHAEHVSARTADASDVVERSVRAGYAGDFALGSRVAEDDSLAALEFSKSGFVRKVVAIHVANGNAKNFAFAAGVGKRRVCVFNPHINRFTDILQSRVAHERSGEQSGFAKDL